MTDFGNIPEYGPYSLLMSIVRASITPLSSENWASFAGSDILDIGTGNSYLPHLLAKKGAVVVGYDKSPTQIELARAHENARSLGIEYVVATPANIL